MITYNEIKKIYNLPLVELIHQAHDTHMNNFDPNEIQTSQLLSIKTGGCPENCSYCPQSAHYKTTAIKEGLLSVREIKRSAMKAQEIGATRFCMGAAWREVRDGAEFNQVLEAVKEVTKLGLEACCTLGMLTLHQAKRLKEAGLHAYNHNIDTSKEYYSRVISTRGFDERMQTIQNVRNAGLKVCTGGILGLGETDKDRISFLETLSNLLPKPESVTINSLVKIKGTPLEDNEELDPSIIVRVIACSRILMPTAMIRLSAGRNDRTSLEQFLCFYAGANSIFYGEKLLTSPNPSIDDDNKMFDLFGLHSKKAYV